MASITVNDVALDDLPTVSMNQMDDAVIMLPCYPGG